MLRNAIIFLIIAIIAGYLGFGQLSGIAALFAQICVVIFVVLFILSLLKGKR